MYEIVDNPTCRQIFWGPDPLHAEAVEERQAEADEETKIHPFPSNCTFRKDRSRCGWLNQGE